MNPCVRTAISGRPERTKTSYAKRRGVVWGRASDKRRLVVSSVVRRRRKARKSFFALLFHTGKDWRNKRASRGVGRERGSESAFCFDARPSPSRRPTRACSGNAFCDGFRARTVDRGHLLHRARHAGRVHDARAHLLACRKKSEPENVRGVLRQRGGNVRDSRMGFGVRFFACRARIEAICGRLARAHLPRRLCRLCRTRLRPGTGPTR